MKLVYLANYPEHVPTLAKWIMDEWGHASPDTTLESLEEKFRHSTPGIIGRYVSVARQLYRKICGGSEHC